MERFRGGTTQFYLDNVSLRVYKISAPILREIIVSAISVCSNTTLKNVIFLTGECSHFNLYHSISYGGITKFINSFQGDHFSEKKFKGGIS